MVFFCFCVTTGHSWANGMCLGFQCFIPYSYGNYIACLELSSFELLEGNPLMPQPKQPFHLTSKLYYLHNMKNLFAVKTIQQQ